MNSAKAPDNFRCILVLFTIYSSSCLLPCVLDQLLNLFVIFEDDAFLTILGNVMENY